MAVNSDKPVSDKESKTAAPPLKPPVGLMLAFKTHQENTTTTNSPVVFSPIHHHRHTSFTSSPITHYEDKNSIPDSITIIDSPASEPYWVPPRWLDMWMEMVKFKVVRIVRLVYGSFSLSKGVFLSFRSIAGLVVVFMYCRMRRRLRAGKGERGRLIGAVKERDEIIKQLLDQLSQMNQVLLTLLKVSSTS